MRIAFAEQHLAMNINFCCTLSKIKQKVPVCIAANYFSRVDIHRANFADFILDLRNCYSK
jgi:hypothetical protein